MRQQLKAAFTAWPFCAATYVCIVGMISLLMFGWKPVKIDPPIYDSFEASAIADNTAKKLGGAVWHVTNTGSMKPLLRGGEYAVTVAKFSEVKQGQVLVYRATYNANPIIHRAVEHDRDGWIMSGDSAKHTETWARVTAANYLGTVVLIYRQI